MTGIDISPSMIEVARARCGGRGRFLIGDLGHRLRFDDNSFDRRRYADDAVGVPDDPMRIVLRWRNGGGSLLDA